MQIQIKKSATFRRTLRSKLRKYHKLHNTAIFIHRIQCSLTEFTHMLPDFYIIGAAKCGTTSPVSTPNLTPFSKFRIWRNW